VGAVPSPAPACSREKSPPPVAVCKVIPRFETPGTNILQSCGLTQWEDISPDLARNVQTIHQTENGPTSRPQAGFPSRQSSQTTKSATEVNGMTGTMSGAGSEPVASNIDTAKKPDIATALSSTPASSSQYSSRVLLRTFVRPERLVWVS
jgi:hypothetical protein